jgi:predicted ABC-type ATPase
MQEIIIIAGPNGAGKTSFANEYFPYAREGLLFVNADEIAREIAASGLPASHRDLRAGREMLRRIDQLVADGVEFMFETTLASLTYAQKIPRWQHSGYHVSLIFLRLPGPSTAIERVRGRVLAGGHGIPEEIIRQRFDKSLRYLEEIYKPLVDDWSVWDSLDGSFRVAEMWDD